MSASTASPASPAYVAGVLDATMRVNPIKNGFTLTLAATEPQLFDQLASANAKFSKITTVTVPALGDKPARVTSTALVARRDDVRQMLRLAIDNCQLASTVAAARAALTWASLSEADQAEEEALVTLREALQEAKTKETTGDDAAISADWVAGWFDAAGEVQVVLPKPATKPDAAGNEDDSAAEPPKKRKRATVARAPIRKAVINLPKNAKGLVEAVRACMDTSGKVRAATPCRVEWAKDDYVTLAEIVGATLKVKQLPEQVDLAEALTEPMEA